MVMAEIRVLEHLLCVSDLTSSAGQLPAHSWLLTYSGEEKEDREVRPVQRWKVRNQASEEQLRCLLQINSSW